MKRAAMVALLLAVAGCSTSTQSTTGQDTAPGKYDQTWKRPYAKTTCDDWTSRMTKRENFVFAADAVVAHWKRDAATELPDDTVVNDMVRDITTLCGTPVLSSGLALSAVETAIQADPARYKP